MATWRLDPEVTHLNHGSFGAAPIEVLAYQQELRDQLESNPVSFMLEDYQQRLEQQRDAVADFVGGDREGLVFVPNATYGVNSVLRSLEPQLGEGDEILVTDHGYNACRQAVEVTAAATGAKVTVASVPFPIERPAQVTEAVLAAVTDRTRLVLVDHITSPTAVVFPVADIVAQLEPDIPVLVDGAHAPGMVALDLSVLGASFYTANCHKWLCAPKGAALLHVAEPHRDAMTAVSISHGRNGQWPGSGSDFHARFDWTGTDDPTARLSIATAIEVMGEHHRDGWPGLRQANHELALAGSAIVAQALGCERPAPADMVGSIVALPLPDLTGPVDSLFDDLARRLRSNHKIEAPAFIWPDAPRRFVRVSAQAYNRLDDYERLAQALTIELAQSASRAARNTSHLTVPQ